MSIQVSTNATADKSPLSPLVLSVRFHSGSDAGLLGAHPAFIETALPSSSFREVRPLSWMPFESVGTGMEGERSDSCFLSTFVLGSTVSWPLPP